MGTRNLTSVIYQEKTRVAQYGQWDGYPEGQGKTVLEFLQSFNPELFKEQLSKIHWITEEEADKVQADENWPTTYPYLSRDAGAGILNAIHKGEIEVQKGLNYKTIPCKVEFLKDSSDFLKDTLFCEWAYIINLDTNTLEVYAGTTEPVKTYSISDLPTFEQFVKDFETKEEEDNA